MKIVGKILATLYSILFTFLLLTLSIGIAASNLFRPEFLTSVLKATDLKEVSAKDLGLSDDPNASLEDYLADQLVEVGFDDATSKAILENDEIKEVVGNLLGEIINYEVDDENYPKPSVSKKDVETIINNEEVRKQIDGEISDEDIDDLVEALNEILSEMFEDGGEEDAD